MLTIAAVAASTAYGALLIIQCRYYFMLNVSLLRSRSYNKGSFVNYNSQLLLPI